MAKGDRLFDHRALCNHCGEWRALCEDCEQCLRCCDCPPKWTRGKSVMGAEGQRRVDAARCCGEIDEFEFGYDYGKPFPEEVL